MAIKKEASDVLKSKNGKKYVLVEGEDGKRLLKSANGEKTIVRRWYVIRAIASKELKAKEAIEDEVQKRELGDLITQVVVPVEKVYQQRNGKKVMKEHILYSGYVFVECILTDEVQSVLLSAANVLGFLSAQRNGTVPMPMSDAEADRMIGRQDKVADVTEEEEVPYIVGETVKVIDGSFQGFSGKIEDIDEEKKKLSVMIKIFGRETPLELAYYQVEKEA